METKLKRFNTMSTIKTDEVLKGLSNPDTEDDVVKDLLNQSETWTDEHGNTHEIIRLGQIVMPAAMLRNRTKDKRHPRYCRDAVLRDSDVFLATFPKTGTHWLNNLIYFMLRKGPLGGIKSISISCMDWVFPHELALEQVYPKPRLLPLHLLPSLWPNGALCEGRRLVLVFRNPKDTAVSLYHFLQKERTVGDGLNISWNCFLEKWMNDSLLYFNYFDYFIEWDHVMKANKDLDILLVCFEDLHKDGLKEMRRIRDYLDLDHSDEKLQEILDRCSLNTLRDDVDLKRMKSPLIDENGKSVLYRKGAVGDWRHHFTVAQSDAMDKLIEEKFNGTIFEQLAKCN